MCIQKWDELIRFQVKKDKILLTGSSGFLGNSIKAVFSQAELLVTVGRSISNSIQIDLRSHFELNESFDCIIHAAGKAHVVPRNAEEIKAFWDVNVLGTQNLLKAMEQNPPKRFVLISTVAVYGASTGVLLNENTPLLATDPYGQSKIQAETDVQAWCLRNDVICTILRLPLVYGENPPGNLKAMIQGIKKGYYFNIAGGQARKSMVHAEDVARFILPASEVGGIFHLTDGVHPSFCELSHFLGGRKRIPNLPFGLAKILAKIGDFVGLLFPINSIKLSKLMSELTFDDSLARKKFGWDPRPVVDYSTVTDFAKLRGLSTSKPRNTPM